MYQNIQKYVKKNNGKQTKMHRENIQKTYEKIQKCIKTYKNMHRKHMETCQKE